MTVKVAKRDILWSGQTLVRVPGRRQRISACGRLIPVTERDGQLYAKVLHREFAELITGPDAEKWQSENRELSRLALDAIARTRQQRKRDHA